MLDVQKTETLDTASDHEVMGSIVPQAPQPAEDTVAAPTTDYATSLDAAQCLAKDIRRLMDGVENTALKGDVKSRIENLNRWAKTYCEGLNAARKIGNRGLSGLYEAQKEISLALEEYLRLDDEGGQPSTDDDARKTDELRHALKRINRLIPAIENSFGQPTELSPATGIASAIKPS